MRYFIQRNTKSTLQRFIKLATLITILLAAGLLDSTARADDFKPNLYVPYEDLVHLIDPADKAVLMDRAKFEKLLAKARANALLTDTLELGQVKHAEYSAKISREQLTLTGKLDVVSIGSGPVAVPLAFGGVGLTSVTLDGSPAPLGYDKDGKLTLIVRTKGDHKLEITGAVKLKELASGGMQFSISLPQAVAGRINLVAQGDLEIHSTVPASEPSYDKQTDATTINLTIGGQSKLAVVLLGNGRQEDDRAILLGESAATVNLTRSHQTLSCLYTAQVLRRGVRQLQFQLPARWTITQVSSPNLVKWSVESAEQIKTLTVRLRSAKVGTTAVHIKATAPRTSQSWDAPRIDLLDAAFQRGFLMVNTDETLGVRGENIREARREDALAAGSVNGLIAGSTGPLYFHWGHNWAVNLEMVDVQLKRSIKEHQKIVVSPQQVTLTGEFEVTAVERELFTLSFVLRGDASQWRLNTVLVNGKHTGFEYRIEENPNSRLLEIELPRPIQPEKTVNVTIVTQYVPADWLWPSDAPDRTVTAPLIESRAETVSGHVSLWAQGDLDISPEQVPDRLEPVPVGRMASLGMTGAVQHAYSHNKPASGDIRILVSRRRPRKSADSVGVVTVRPREFSADWRITYEISRASAKRLYLLADKTLGRELSIASATVPINSKNIVTPGEESVPLSPELAARYNLWRLNLDHAALGNVVIDISYERPLTDNVFEVPLVRPICRHNGRISEQLAIQASEELALKLDAAGAKEIDAVDLPPLPVQAARILWAFRLDAPATPQGAKTTLKLETDVHENYDIPSALAVAAQLTTYLDTHGGQRTEAAFKVANAGRQFLTIRLPKGAELWSLRVADKQVKPQRSADGDYQVALGRLGKPVAVKIVYSYRPENAALERLDLGGIELPGVEINQMSWAVVPPPGYRITTQQTKMLTDDLQQPTPAYRKLYNFLTANVFSGSLLLPSLTGTQKYDVVFTGGADIETEEGIMLKAAKKTPAEKPELMNRQSDVRTAHHLFEDQSAVAKSEKQLTNEDLGVNLRIQGRSTLPVNLIPTAGAGPRATFAALGSAELTIGLTTTAWMSACWALGVAIVATIAIAIIAKPPKAKATLTLAVLSAASLLAIWRPEMVYFANGAFTAGICLIPIYLAIAFARLLWAKLPAPDSASAITMIFLACILSFGCSAQAATPPKPTAPTPKQNQPADNQLKITPNHSDSLIIPYDSDPTATEDSDKVLIPYARYVKLWNQAHPNDVIAEPKPGMDVSLAAVRYSVKIEGEQLTLILTADIKTYGPDWVVLPMPISGLAVVEATIDGKPAQFHSPPQTKKAAPNTTVLMLPPKTSGRLILKAVGKPKYFGRRGTAKFSLPPLPGAVMDVVLPQKDLELEVDGVDTRPARQEKNEIEKWTVPLGMARQITLRWSPKAGGGAEDSTLSAASNHDIYAFHWAVVAVSKITYTFSAGEHDRFAILAPKGTTITEIKGTNIRDYRNLGERTVDGKNFDLIEVRLHRPAKKKYDLTVRWLGELPPSDQPVNLLLVRAADVSRESGAVTLHSAGGMAIKVAKVAGARRTAIPTPKNAPELQLTADRAKPVARYYWPYRPFALSVQFSRLTLTPKVSIDQLVRLSTDRTELLAEATITADRGKIFGASFILPLGYELLSVVGPAVENFYERSAQNRRFLHVKFDRGRKNAKIAIVLVRRDARNQEFDVPVITYIDSDAPAPNQKGRLAVQLAASLNAKTLSAENLKPIVPRTLRDWLDAQQVNSVQFAYSYEQDAPSLRLDIRPEPTRVRVEAFVGLAVKATAAAYTYRLRYNITGSPIDNLQFSLPTEYAPLTAVNSPALRSVTKSNDPDGRTTWKVVLVNEVTGRVDIAVNFAVPIDASTKTLPIPRIETKAPAGYHAIVAVQNLSRHDINIKDQNTQNLTELALSEQRKLRMPRQMTESLQYVFQSFEPDWSLNLDFTPAKTAARIQIVVDLLALTTVIDRNGRCRYEAKLELQNRSEQFLEVKVPKGLNLWSATVASQPVKPVTDSNATTILIPLVKTSPGGLPYDVTLYFGDDQANPLIQPLNGITNLKPPAISIPSIPVTRTTWSLRLPAGYRYIRPGGNMSAVAGTVEILSLNIDAKLDQLKRLDRTYRDVSGSSTRNETVARYNWGIFNSKLTAEIQQAQSFLEANKRQISEDDYERLNSQLGGQVRKQEMLLWGNNAYIQEQTDLARNDLNVYINADNVNRGLAESDRNKALQQKPTFITKGEQQQIARLEKELEVSQKRLTVLNQQVITATDADAIALGTEMSLSNIGQNATSLILAPSDKNAETRGILTELSKQSAAQIDRKQIQIRNQLEELKDNRLQRHYKPQQEMQMFQTIAPQAQAGLDRPQGSTSSRTRSSATRRQSGDNVNFVDGHTRFDNQTQDQARGLGRGGGVAGGVYAFGTTASGNRSAQPQLPGSQSTLEAGEVRAFALDIDADGKPISSTAATQQYIAKGTYSLPVTLPQGQIRLDFARPAGNARLTLWAVPEKTIQNVKATAAVLAALLAIFAAIKIWPTNKTSISAKRAIAYLVLFIVWTAILGIIGLILSLIITFAAEAIRAAKQKQTQPVPA